MTLMQLNAENPAAKMSTGTNGTNDIDLRKLMRRKTPATRRGMERGGSTRGLSTRGLSPTKPALKKSVNSTGALQRNKISFGGTETLVFEKEIGDQDHKNAVWFSDKEMKAIRKDIRSSVKKSEITRGLECHADTKETRFKRQQHRQGILNLHREQRRVGMENAETLHYLSRATSADDLNRALRLASMDSTQAFQEHLQTPKTCITRTSSGKALDNLRKTINVSKLTPYSANKSTSALSRLNRIGGPGGIGGSGNPLLMTSGNATFAPSKPMNRKEPNMLLEAMAKKGNPRTKRPTVNGVAAVA
ncbi:expressed unknown protein [Seminavis robusta]|uniref:Uncharacterized protein n=1 Tax=Seminavis robusta TaxID=568900 RepID=A0A9N8ET96_9STRA|nr:expressed unknown protein [Seminavis robusta]|eukprot:Sro1521_g279470.1 n/a (304) ;mRNA; f:11168-12079